MTFLCANGMPISAITSYANLVRLRGGSFRADRNDATSVVESIRDVLSIVHKKHMSPESTSTMALLVDESSTHKVKKMPVTCCHFTFKKNAGDVEETF